MQIRACGRNAHMVPQTRITATHAGRKSNRRGTRLQMACFVHCGGASYVDVRLRIVVSDVHTDAEHVPAVRTQRPEQQQAMGFESSVIFVY